MRSDKPSIAGRALWSPGAGHHAGQSAWPARFLQTRPEDGALQRDKLDTISSARGVTSGARALRIGIVWRG